MERVELEEHIGISTDVWSFAANKDTCYIFEWWH